MISSTDYWSSGELRDRGFASVGRNCFVSHSAHLASPSRIHLGDNVRIDAFSIMVARCPIKIGSHVHIGSSVTLNALADIVIGNFSGISSGCKLFTTDDDYGGEFLTGPTVSEELTNIVRDSIEIDEHCIVGANSVILPGARLATGVAVGALSLVKGHLSAWTIYGGVPARALRDRSRALLDKVPAI